MIKSTSKKLTRLNVMRLKQLLPPLSSVFLLTWTKLTLNKKEKNLEPIVLKQSSTIPLLRWILSLEKG